MPFIPQVRAALQAGDYAKAIYLYERAKVEQPELAHFYQQSLNRLHRRQGLIQIGDTTAVSNSASALKVKGVFPNPHAQADCQVMLKALYQQIALVLPAASIPDETTAPLVSVLMTTHNLADYIEEAVTSVLRQSWPNLELIVVDDASTDSTWTKLQRLQKTVDNLLCKRLNTNLGTYFAKNHALQLAKGAFIFFQDGDDICHPERIRLSMQHLMQVGVICVQGAYSRVSFPSGLVLPVNGMVSKLGFITLGLRREVFDLIGYFNCTSKASDEEFFRRLQAWVAVKGGEFRTLDLPLYYSCFREGSLFADMHTATPQQDEGITQQPSASRVAYIEAFARLHRALGVEGFKSFFRFPVLRDLIPVLPDMSYLPNPTQPVVVCLCSIPERIELLRQTLASLTPQVDALHVYLDRYEVVPEFVINCHPQVTVYMSQDYPGLRDNGKFLAFAAQKSDCYYFTADDDIVYPPDYVASLVRSIEHYGRQVVVGVHGVLIPENAQRYFSGYRNVFLFHRGLESDALVNNLGTGTVAFHAALLKGLDVSFFHEAGMADLYLSVFCKQRGVPMVAVARPDDWLQTLPSPNTSLYEEAVQSDCRQSALVRNHRPWGYAAIAQTLEAAGARAGNETIRSRLAELVPKLHQCLG